MPKPDGQQWRFLYNRPEHSWQSHQVVAYPPSVDPKKEPEGDVGFMEWERKSGRVTELFVGQDFRRRGVATGMWNEAHRVAEAEKDVPKPQHSEQRTLSGDKWAHSVGGRIPPLLHNEHTEYYD